MTAPLVSVCIPTFNQERFLRETLESVLQQSYTDFEILVIDDCSSDLTGKIAREYAARNPKVRFLPNPVNLGMVANWNRCLELARGKYIKYLFGDDFFAISDALEKMVDAMEGTPGVVLASCARTIVDEQSHKICDLSNFPDGFTADGHEVVRHCFQRITRVHNLIGEPSAVMFRRDVSGRGFDPRYRQLVDLEMWLHLLEQGRFVYLAETLCSFRHHAEQQTKKNEIELNYVDDLIYLFDDYLEKPYVGIGRVARAYLIYYQFYKLMKHARQGQHDMALAKEKIRRLYGMRRFVLLRPFYRLYTPYWLLMHRLAKAAGRE